jgi:stage II sporulation protein D
LREGGYKIGKISAVKILSKNMSGRVDKIKIDDANGGSVTIAGKDFRHMLGPNEVRSAKFGLSLGSNVLVLDGMGWGHGAGMCQWGAYGMARHGKKVDEILKYYYPGAEITTIDKLKK